MDMDNKQIILARYTTPQFRIDPVGSLAKLMDLQAVMPEIRENSSTVFPILCGIIVYRHLDRAAKQDVNRAILHGIPRSRLTTHLMGLVGELSRHHNLYAWSLTDDELRAYYESNKNMAEILSGIGVSAISTPSVAAVAAAIYEVAKNGVKAQARATVKTKTSTPRVAEVAKKMGVGPELARGLGMATLAALAAMTLLYTNASGNQKRAEKEQALRNLTRLEDW